MVRREQERAKLSEERAERLVKDAQERSERDLRMTKEDADKRVKDVERLWKDRLEGERRAHESELRGLNANFDTRIHTEKTTAEIRASTLQNDVERERLEKQRYQHEAEEKGDLPAQIQKFTVMAETMGYSRESGEQPADWKTTLMGVGANLAEQLPQILSNAGEAVAKAKGGAPAVQVVQQPGLMPMAHPQALPPPMAGPPPLTFATEESLDDFDGGISTPEPRYPTPAGAEPGPPGPVAPPAVRPQPPFAPAAAPVPVAAQVAPPPAPPVAATPPQPAPALQSAKRGRRPKPEAAAGSALEISPQDALKYKDSFEDAIRAGVSANDFAEGLTQAVSPAMLAAMAEGLSPEAVRKALMATPEGQRSPLVRREGQRYLKDVLRALKATAA
jgi:hypothetical protein